MTLDFTDKVALVTGAASGIGRTCAQFYAREGAKVAVSDIAEAGGLGSSAGFIIQHVKITIQTNQVIFR